MDPQSIDGSIDGLIHNPMDCGSIASSVMVQYNALLCFNEAISLHENKRVKCLYVFESTYPCLREGYLK